MTLAILSAIGLEMNPLKFLQAVIKLVFLSDLIIYVSVNIFSVMSGWVFLG